MVIRTRTQAWFSRTVACFIVLICTMASIAMAAPHDEKTHITSGGLLPTQLERELTEVRDSLAKAQSEPDLGADLTKALDHWFAKLKEGQEKLLADKTPEARAAFLGVLEEAVGDLQTRMNGLTVPAHRLIGRYQDIYRQLRMVQANLTAANKNLNDQLAAGDEGTERLESKTREMVAIYLRSGKTDTKAKRELYRLKVQLKMLPFRREILRTNAAQLKALGTVVEKLSNSARAMEENIDAALVGFHELAEVYGDLKTNIQLNRVVASSASQLIGSDYQRLLNGLSELSDKQAGFLEALKAGTSIGSDLTQLQETVSEQQRVGNQILERVGGAGNIDDLIEKFGPKPGTKAE